MKLINNNIFSTVKKIYVNVYNEMIHVTIPVSDDFICKINEDISDSFDTIVNTLERNKLKAKL